MSLVSKLSIANCILKAEASSKLTLTDSDRGVAVLRTVRDTWLGYVCRYGGGEISPQKFPYSLADVTFVTFNYDRCLEQFMLIWAQNVLSKPEAEVASLERDAKKWIPVFRNKSRDHK